MISSTYQIYEIMSVTYVTCSGGYSANISLSLVIAALLLVDVLIVVE